MAETEGRFRIGLDLYFLASGLLLAMSFHLGAISAICSAISANVGQLWVEFGLLWKLSTHFGTIQAHFDHLGLTCLE